MVPQPTSVVDQQDSLRSIRNFLSLVNGATQDQSWSGQDGVAVNSPGQVGVQGPNGVAVEGQPVTLASRVNLQFTPGMMIVAALAIYLLTR